MSERSVLFFRLHGQNLCGDAKGFDNVLDLVLDACDGWFRPVITGAIVT